MADGSPHPSEGHRPISEASPLTPEDFTTTRDGFSGVVLHASNPLYGAKAMAVMDRLAGPPVPKMKTDRASLAALIGEESVAQMERKYGGKLS